MEHTGRPTGARFGQQSGRNGAPRPPTPPGGGQDSNGHAGQNGRSVPNGSGVPNGPGAPNGFGVQNGRNGHNGAAPNGRRVGEGLPSAEAGQSGSGFGEGWFTKPGEQSQPMPPVPMPPAPRPPSGQPMGPPSVRRQPVDPPSVRRPPVDPPSVRRPPVDPPSGHRPPVDPPSGHRPPVEQPFDRERFENAMTDPGPFGRVPFETPTIDRGPTRQLPRPRPEPTPADDDYDDALDHDGDDDDRDDTPAGETRTRRKLPFWVELPLLVVVALVLTFVIQTFVARVYVIPSGSMELTLNGNNGSGDRILVDKVVYDFHDPKPGDVVVFKGPTGWDQTEFFVDNTTNPVTHWLRQLGSSIGVVKPDEYDLVKRVIAVGGQTVACCDAQNRETVNGKALDEPYVYWQPGRPGPTEQLRFGPITIPQGYLWVEGDNRSNSDDSRYQNGGGIHGIVPVGNVIGKARTIIWPPSRWQGIGDHDPQAMAIASAAPGWGAALPSTGIGALAALPTLWFGRRFGVRLRTAAGLPSGKRRRRRASGDSGTAE